MTAWLRRILAWLAAMIPDLQPRPPLPPDPEPEPPKPQPPSPLDAIDPATVSWDEPAGNVGAWPITATLTQAAMTRDGMRARRDGGDSWPVRQDGGTKASIGNWWIIALCADGKLHGATVEWLGIGKTVVTGKRWDGTDDIHGRLSWDFRPYSTMKCYIMQSTVARAAPWTIKERTNIVEVRYP